MFNNGGKWYTPTEDGYKALEPDNKTSIDKMQTITALTDYEFSTGQKVEGFFSQAEKDIENLKNNVLSSIKITSLIALSIGTIYLISRGGDGRTN